jgi:hypothetical protein
VARWRFDQFRALGFGGEDAFLLTVSSVDLQAARTLVEAGALSLWPCGSCSRALRPLLNSPRPIRMSAGMALRGARRSRCSVEERAGLRGGSNSKAART